MRGPEEPACAPSCSQPAVGSAGWGELTAALPPALTPLQGVSSIALSWVFSPVLTGLLALSLFVVLRALVLRSPHAYKRAYFVLPVFIFITFFM